MKQTKIEFMTSTFEIMANEYMNAYQERKSLEKQLRDLEGHQLEAKGKLVLELDAKKREEQKLLDKLEQCKCGKTAKGHEFPPIDDETSEKKSRICTKCGFEKK